MTELHSLVFAGTVALLTVITGSVIYFVRRHRMFLGYPGHESDVLQIKDRLKGEIFRDGDDLVISGNFGKTPAIVRLSAGIYTPGVNVEMKLPSTFSLSIFPAQMTPEPEGQPVDIGSRRLANRYRGRTKSVAEARLLLDSKQVIGELEKLCTSSKLFFELTPGHLSLGQFTIPDHLYARVMEQLEAGVKLGEHLAALPGSHQVKILPIKHEHGSWTLRAAMAMGTAIAAFCMIAAARDLQAPAQAATVKPEKVNAILPVDAQVIPMLKGWRPATESDIDPYFLSLLRSTRSSANYPLSFDADGSGEHPASAYLLVDANNRKRVVVIMEHRVIFDSVFPNIAGIAAVSKEDASAINWQSGPMHPDFVADGILLVRDSERLDSATLLYFSPKGVISGVPQDYRHLSLQ